MNANEYKLRILTQEISYYETEDENVKQYNKLKQQREDILNELSRNW